MRRKHGELGGLVSCELPSDGEIATAEIARRTGISKGLINAALRSLRNKGQARQTRRGFWQARNGVDANVEHLASLRRSKDAESTDTTALRNVARIVRAMRNHYQRKAEAQPPHAAKPYRQIATSLELSALHADNALSAIQEGGL